MNILLPISTEQNLLFIPRKDVPTVTLSLTNELTQTTESFELGTDYDNGYMTVIIEFGFKEGDRYSYEVNDLDGSLLYRGKILVTEQTDLQNFKVNDILYA